MSRRCESRVSGGLESDRDARQCDRDPSGRRRPLLAGVLSRTLALLALASPVAAVTGTGSLAIDADAADLLRVTCFDDGSGPPLSLVTSVTDTSPTATAFVSVQIRKDDLATNSTDPIDTDSLASPTVWVDGGAGDYDVFVDKSAVGAETYSLNLQCMTGTGGSGGPTGTLVPAWANPVPVSGPMMTFGVVAALLCSGVRRLRRPKTPIRLMPMVSVAVGMAGLSIPTPASAHTQNGTLDSPASATDYYRVTCFDDGGGTPGSVVIRIRDASPGALPVVSVQVQRGDGLTSISDATTADAVPSPEVALNEGAGVYHILVDKSGPGSKFYSLEYHCTTGPDGGGVHTGSTISIRQNQ